MELYTKAIRKLVENECLRVRDQFDRCKDKRVVIIPAGNTAENFYLTLKNEYGIEAEFFVDNDSEKHGKTIFDKPILSFSDAFLHNDSPDDFFVVVATAYHYYYEIVNQLKEDGFLSIIHQLAIELSHLWERYDNVASLLSDDESLASYFGALYAMMTGDVTFVKQCVFPQYFAIKEFSHNTRLPQPIIADIGAYTGDTLEKFIERSPSNVKIYAFEPFEKLHAKIRSRIDRLICDNAIGEESIEIVPAGAGKETGVIRFAYSGNNNMIMQSEAGTITVKIYSLDDFFKDKNPPTVIKADIEGDELNMLMGAKNLIEEYKPKLAICIYHSGRDMASIAEYIHSIVPEYRMYVRTHYCNYKETVLYCAV